MMAMFWELANLLAPDDVARHQTNVRPLRNADLEELSRRWAKAGLSDVRAERLELTMPFRSFEEFWLPFTSGVTPLSAFAAELDRASHGELERLYRTRLSNVRPDGTFEFAARALAVSGIAGQRSGS